MYSQRQESLETLQDIRNMMERSSRFISLSGWSGIAAGACALSGAWMANTEIKSHYMMVQASLHSHSPGLFFDGETFQLLVFTALGTFAAACGFAFIFTFLRSKRTGVPLWGLTAKRLLVNTLVPLMAGGIVIIRLVQVGYYELIASSCLIFYGLALINASKYTLIEIRYLGFAELLTGLLALWSPDNGLYYWAGGFGLLHIIYGIVMWWKYERVKS